LTINDLIITGGQNVYAAVEENAAVKILGVAMCVAAC
jgi:hypothetical protein